MTTALSSLPLATGRELIERALTLVPPDSHDAGRLQALRILPLRPDYDRGQEAFHHARPLRANTNSKTTVGYGDPTAWPTAQTGVRIAVRCTDHDYAKPTPQLYPC